MLGLCVEGEQGADVAVACALAATALSADEVPSDQELAQARTTISLAWRGAARRQPPRSVSLYADRLRRSGERLRLVEMVDALPGAPAGGRGAGRGQSRHTAPACFRGARALVDEALQGAGSRAIVLQGSTCAALVVVRGRLYGFRGDRRRLMRLADEREAEAFLVDCLAGGVAAPCGVLERT